MITGFWFIINIYKKYMVIIQLTRLKTVIIMKNPVWAPILFDIKSNPPRVN